MTRCHGARPSQPSSCSEYCTAILVLVRADGSFIDPTLELDVYADKPWALSPVVSTMTRLKLKRLGDKPGEKKEDADEKDRSAIVDEDALGVIPGTSPTGSLSMPHAGSS